MTTDLRRVTRPLQPAVRWRYWVSATTGCRRIENSTSWNCKRHSKSLPRQFSPDLGVVSTSKLGIWKPSLYRTLESLLDVIEPKQVMPDAEIIRWLHFGEILFQFTFDSFSWRRAFNDHAYSGRHIEHHTLWLHDDVIKWKHIPRYWPFVQEIHRSPVNSPHKVQWRGALMFSLIWAGNLRRHRARYDVIVMSLYATKC